MQQPSKSHGWLDGVAVALSALCLLHCLALPLVVAGLPMLAQFSGAHLHAQLLVIVIPLSVAALGIGYRCHRSNRVLALGGIGMLLLILGATLAHAYLGLLADRILTIGGALTLAVAHYLNSIYSRRRHPVNG